MKNKIFISLIIIVLCTLLVGCNTKKQQKTIENKKEKTNNTEWIINTEDNELFINEDILNTFNKAINNSNEDLVPVALLGTQIVSGTNYMFLTRTTNNPSYKIITIYKDLQDNISITNTNNFNIEDYANKDISITKETITGGWEIQIPGKPIMLEENIQNSFDTATENINDIIYYPIKVLGTNKDNTQYIILCYERISNKNSISVITLDYNNNKILTVAEIDLKEYNK